MDILLIDQACDDDYGALAAIWERSVKATHSFLSDSEREYYKSLLPEYFENVELWKMTVNGVTAAFIGLSDMIEMLFVDPAYFRQHPGSRLLKFAIDQGMTQVDVNEENPGAIAFYEAMGFRRKGRSAVDMERKPHPIIHMSL